MEGGELDAAVKVGVRSDEGPRAIVDRADLVVDGVSGCHRRSGGPGRVRFVDFLRASVLLFAGAATALGVVAIAGSADAETYTPVVFAVAWWTVAAAAGLWLGRRMAPTPGIERLLASARSTHTLPELEPGSVIVTRLWPLGVGTVITGGIAFAGAPAGRDRRGLCARGGADVAAAGVRGAGDRGPRRRPLPPGQELALRRAEAGAHAVGPEDRAGQLFFRNFLSWGQVRVLATSALVSQARRAVATP